MEDLIKYFKELQTIKQSLELTIEYEKVCDWFLSITHKDSNTYIYSGDCASLKELCIEDLLHLKEWAEQYEELEDIFYNIFD